jgi:hypothetical protein
MSAELMARLERQRPDLSAMVARAELSLNVAMIAAGLQRYRNPRPVRSKLQPLGGALALTGHGPQSVAKRRRVRMKWVTELTPFPQLPEHERRLMQLTQSGSPQQRRQAIETLIALERAARAQAQSAPQSGS